MMHCSAASTAAAARSSEQQQMISPTRLGLLHIIYFSIGFHPSSLPICSNYIPSTQPHHTTIGRGKDLDRSSSRALAKAAMPAKVRSACVTMMAAGRVDAASRGSTAKHLCSKPPRTPTPPERVSSSPLSSLDTQVSQHSSTAACTDVCINVSESLYFRLYYKPSNDIPFYWGLSCRLHAWLVRSIWWLIRGASRMFSHV